MLSCAGAYVSGVAGYDACPAGSVRIVAEAACSAAAAATGKTFIGVTSSSGAPRGCYYVTTNSNAWLNTYATGSSLYAQLLCARSASQSKAARRTTPCAGVCVGLCVVGP